MKKQNLLTNMRSGLEKLFYVYYYFIFLILSIERRKKKKKINYLQQNTYYLFSCFDFSFPCSFTIFAFSFFSS
jgi:hypothetical protein